jgi:hypothetical protein
MGKDKIASRKLHPFLPSSLIPVYGRRPARELLAPVNNGFTEGFDTLDLKEAKTLLEELAA